MCKAEVTFDPLLQKKIHAETVMSATNVVEIYSQLSHDLYKLQVIIYESAYISER